MSKWTNFWNGVRNIWVSPRWAFALGMGSGVSTGYLAGGGWLPASPIFLVFIALLVFVAFMVGLLLGAILSISEDQD